MAYALYITTSIICIILIICQRLHETSACSNRTGRTVRVKRKRHCWCAARGGQGPRRLRLLRRTVDPPPPTSRRTSREPAAGVMDRRRSGQRSDSESRSMRTAGLGQPAGPRHSPAPTGVRRGTPDGHGWIGSKAVEIREAGSDRPPSKSSRYESFNTCRWGAGYNS